MMTVRAQLLVSGANREEVLKALHDSTHGGGHSGAKRTAEKYHNDFIGHVGQRLLQAYCKEFKCVTNRNNRQQLLKAELVLSSELSQCSTLRSMYRGVPK